MIFQSVGVFWPDGLPVFFSRVGLSTDPAICGRWKNRSQIKGIAELQEVVEQLAVRSDEVTILKYMPSVFHSTELNTCLVQHGVDTLIVCGLVTSGCVRATVVDAFSRNYRVVVPVECVADPPGVGSRPIQFVVSMVVPGEGTDRVANGRSELLAQGGCQLPNANVRLSIGCPMNRPVGLN